MEKKPLLKQFFKCKDGEDKDIATPTLKSSGKVDEGSSNLPLETTPLENPSSKIPPLEAFSVSHNNFLIKSDTLYIIPSDDTVAVVANDLDLIVNPGRTVRANYIIKYQTNNVAWATSFGFLSVDTEKDNLMGTAHWAMSKGGQTSTTYSFMTGDPRFYTNTGAGVADSNVPFSGIDKKNIFNSLKIDIEYFNGGSQQSILSLEVRRDLYNYKGVKQQVLPGSSVEYRVY
jgi:hypothetical protein